MPDAVTVRPARAADVDSIVSLWREMWDFHVPLDPRFRSTPAADLVMRGWIEGSLQNERAAVFVAEDAGGALQGYILVLILENPPVIPWPFYGHVSEIAARPRRAGIGGKLLDAAHAWFRERRIPYVEVNVSVKNDVARSFWRKRGYGDFLERLRIELPPEGRDAPGKPIE